MAAVLACGDGAVLSHLDAAALHDLRHIGSGKIDVTAPSRHNLPGVCCHYAPVVHPEDATTVDGIPVTTVARTYLDIAEVLSQRRLLEALEAGERQEKLDYLAFDAVIGRNHGRHGIKPLQAALSDVKGDWLQSPREREFRALIRAHGLPEPDYNVYVEGELVDAVWSDYRLIAEVDGWGFHRSRRSFGADRARDRRLIRAGWTVVRFTGDEVKDHPAGVAAELSELLRDGPWPPPAR